MTTACFSKILFSALLGLTSVSFGDTKKVSEAGVCEACGTSKSNSALSKLIVSADEVWKLAPSLPNDPRRPLDRKSNPEYNPIGTVAIGNSRGSGWLANECLVWTAKHVIGKHQNIIGKKVKFSVGQPSTPDKDFEYVVEGEVVSSGNPTGNGADHATEDWALIKLKSSIGKHVGYIKTAQYSVEDAGTCKTLEVAGFPGEKDTKKLWWQGHCALYPKDSGPDAFSLGCPATPGNSGGPLLCRETDGSLWAIGVMSNQDMGDPTARSFATNFTAEWKENAKPAYQKFMNTCN